MFVKPGLYISISLTLILLGCSALPKQFFAGVDNLPKQMINRQILVTLPESNKSDWLPIREQLARQHDILLTGEFPLTSINVDCLVYRVPEQESLASVVQRLKADKRVQLVQENLIFESLQNSDSAAYTELSYAPKLIHADHAHQLSTGKGVRLAVIDTGAERHHPDLEGQHLETENFVDGSDYSFSHDRHGTAVTGVIAARENDGIGINGIAPEARVSVLKACWYPEQDQAKAQCSSWSLAKALDAAINDNVQIINLSLAGPDDDLLRKLLESAHYKGINVVASTLENKAEPGFPAILPFAVPVISSGPDGRIVKPSWFSDFPNVVAAPGVEILTTVPNDGYDFVSGSSLAAAHVSGVIALLLEKKPDLSPEQIKTLLLQNGQKSRSPTAQTLDAWSILQSVDR